MLTYKMKQRFAIQLQYSLSTQGSSPRSRIPSSVTGKQRGTLALGKHTAAGTLSYQSDVTHTHPGHNGIMRYSAR